ncbi:MAG TPA: hypothetical protein VFX59_05965 [Polyangiales bacterium]|nr:hypothetical protein [Polyangiales bacterium]
MSIGDAESRPPDPELTAAAPERPRALPGAGPERGRFPELNRDELSRVPPLAMLTVAAALVHTVLFRFLVPLFAGSGRVLPAVLDLGARYALNLAAVAGMVSLTVGVLDIVRAKGLTFIGRRAVIAGLAGVLITTLAISTFATIGYVSPQLVLVATGAMHTFVVQLAMTSLRAEHSLAGRTTVGLVAASSLFALASLIVRYSELFAGLGFAQQGVASLLALGELAYLLVPLAAAFAVLPWSDDASGKSARLAGAIAVGFMALLFVAGSRIPSLLYAHVMYSTLRLEWALERASLGYAVPVSLAVGAATAAIFSRDARHRQGGAALWLWLAGGFNPLTPARVFMTALAATLVCRAILGVGSEPSKKPD